MQIQKIKETSKLTKDAVDKSLIRINQVLSVSELSKANKIIQEIQSSIMSKKYELSLIRMKDLKSILIQITYNEDLFEHTKKRRYNHQITDFGSDINNISDFLIGSKMEPNFSKVNQNLENLATVINDCENKLKFKKQ